MTYCASEKGIDAPYCVLRYASNRPNQAMQRTAGRSVF